MQEKVKLHVKHFVYERFLNGQKLIEYRPLCAKYFYLLDPFRIDYERGLKTLTLSVYDGCTDSHLDFAVTDIQLIEFSKIPLVDQKALSECYGSNLQGHYFYALYL